MIKSSCTFIRYPSSEDIEFHDKLTIMVFWTKFAEVKRKIAPLRATVVTTYYIKLVREWAERQ